jgi:polyisoprenyl-phosphate glycosyltransferase
MNTSRSIVAVLPCYNDWEALKILLKQLDTSLGADSCSAKIVIIDDCSSMPWSLDLAKGPFQTFNRIDIVRLRRNMGHQRAICVGLSYTYEHYKSDVVLVMDADGEDRPEDVASMLGAFEKHHRAAIVFAERTRRSENLTFKTGYFLYRALHLALTGIRVKVGNFSLIGWGHLATLVVVSETWNHYAASVFRSRIQHVGVPTARGRRLAGDSKLNLVGLVIHGMSAIAVFLDVVGVRLTLLTLGCAGFLALLCLVVVAVRFGTDIAIPGWATTTLGLLLVLLIQMFMVVIGLTGLVLFNRNNVSFIPIRDYKYFIGETFNIYRPDE